MKTKYRVKVRKPGISLKTLEKTMSEQEYSKKSIGTQTLREVLQNNEVNQNNQAGSGGADQNKTPKETK